MPILIQPLPQCCDDAPLLDVRASLLAARAAICVARGKCRSYEAHDRLGDLISSLEHEIEGVFNIAEAVADSDENRAAARAEWHRCFYPRRSA